MFGRIDHPVRARRAERDGRGRSDRVARLSRRGRGFHLYEDENDNYDYEQGVHATIPFRWDDKQQVLTIGAREGHFPGMLEKRTFRIVWVSPGHGTGLGSTATPDREVIYEGAMVRVPFRG